jgi:hypothetical protein
MFVKTGAVCKLMVIEQRRATTSHQEDDLNEPVRASQEHISWLNTPLMSVRRAGVGVMRPGPPSK